MYNKIYLYLTGIIFISISLSARIYSSTIYPETIIKASANTQYAVVVDKSLQKLFLYKTDDLSLIMSLDCATGENTGRKKVEGDKKTPEGIYFFTAQYEDKDLTPVYGTQAFPIDYPNVMDSHFGRNGDAIWLHGTDKKELIKRSSNGCIALNNKDLNKLIPYLKIKNTPFIILREGVKKKSASKKHVVKEISSLISQWKDSVEGGSYHYYLSFYDSTYLPDIDFWRSWLTLRELEKNITFEVDDLSILLHEDYYVAKFDFSIKKGKYKGKTINKKLFLKEDNGTFKIIGDENLYTLIRNRKIIPDFITSVKETVAYAEEQFLFEQKKKLISDVINQTHEWAKAWSKGDIDTYQRFYSRDFYSEAYKMDLKRWVDHKKSLMDRYKYIKVSVKDEKVHLFKDQIKVVFTQIYNSSSYNETGTKRLFLKPEGDKWKIYRELWTKSY